MRNISIMILVLASIVAADKYAMVFGTAGGVWNYSIASEPCRIYSDLIKGGIKPENIIFMVYAAVIMESSVNPWGGMIFTEPSETTDGDWVKYGCFDNIDYTQRDINGEVFLAIISGDSETVTKKTGKKNPKVLSAGPDDTVFTYFIDHGNTGTMGVGDDRVTDVQLMAAFQSAYEKRLYGQWVWYQETCHSGSIFTSLPHDRNIYVMTSSDGENNAKMSNCPPYSVVAGKTILACLSGLWDNAFMKYYEETPDVTIGDLFDWTFVEVKSKSDQNVCEFGDMSLRSRHLSDFTGILSNHHVSHSDFSTDGIVSVDEVPLHLAKWRAIMAESSDRVIAEKILQEEVIRSATQEVEVMRLGRLLLGEKDADKAMREVSEVYSAGCVRDLTLLLQEKCGYQSPLSKEAYYIIRRICLPKTNIPFIDWSDICL